MTREPTDPAADPSIGPPPNHLDENMRSLWTELAATLPAGAAAASDRCAFELLVNLVARLRAGTLTAAEGSQLRQLLGTFSLTPESRRLLERLQQWQ